MFYITKEVASKEGDLILWCFGLTFPWSLLSGLVIGNEMIGIWRE